MENQVNEEVVTEVPKTGFLAKAKYVAKSVAAPVAVVVTTVALSTNANADITAMDFAGLADKADDIMELAFNSVIGVLATGITIIGSLKGYQVLKGGIRRA